MAIFGSDDNLELLLGLNSREAEKNFQGFLKGLEGSASSAKFDDILTGKFNKSFFDTGLGNQILNDEKRQADFQKFNDNLKTTGTNLTNFGQKMTLFASVPIGIAIAGATKKAAEFNSEIMGAARSLNLSSDETEKFSNEVLKLAPSLGLMPDQFARVALEAGKLGVEKDKVAEFGEVLARLATISDTDIEKFVELGGAIKTQFGLSVTEFEKFGAAVNAIDDNIGGTTPNILAFTAKIGAISKQIGFTAGETAAFGAVFEKLSYKSDVAGTAFKNFANQLFTIKAASNPAKEAFNSLGYDAETFGQIMEADPKAAMLAFLDRLNSIESASERSSLMIKIFGNEGIDAISALAGNTDLLKQAFEQAHDETANMAKMMNEFKNKMNDPIIQSKILKSQFEAISIQFGKVFIPLLSEALKHIVPLVGRFGEFLANNPNFAKFFAIAAVGVATIGPLVVALGSVVGAIGTLGPVLGGVIPGLVSFGAWFTGAVPMVGGFITAIGGFVTSLGLLPVAIAGGVAALLAFSFNLGGVRDKAKVIFENIVSGVQFFIKDFLLSWKNGNNDTVNFFKQLWADLPMIAFNGLTSLGQIVSNGFWTIINTVPRILWNLPGQVYKVFDYFIGGTLDFLIELTGLMDWHVANAVFKAVNALWSFPQNIGSIFGTVRNYIVDGLNNAVSVLGEYSSIFYNAGLNLIKTFAAGIGNAAGEAYNAVSNVVGGVRNYLPFSPAKIGPLSDLDKSGSAFFETFASGLDNSTLQDKLDRALSGVTFGSSPDYSLAGGPAVSGTESGSVVINYSQNITIDTKITSQEIVKALKNSQREFIQYLNEAQFFVNRKQS